MVLLHGRSLGVLAPYRESRTTKEHRSDSIRATSNARPDEEAVDPFWFLVGLWKGLAILVGSGATCLRVAAGPLLHSKAVYRYRAPVRTALLPFLSTPGYFGPQYYRGSSTAE